jgi:two-component system nitrogen regulation sensor histidine kinase NtrY
MRRFLTQVFNLLKWLVIPGAYDPGMDPNDIQDKRRRKVRYLAAGFMGLFILMVVVWLMRHEASLDAPISNDLAVALVLNLLIILLILLTLLVARQLVKLYFDRRGAVAGARFQTKLVLAFLFMTLAPSILMFAVATELLSEAVDKWLNARVETTLSEALQVAESLYSESKERAQGNAEYMAGLVKQRGLLAERSTPSLHRLMRQKLREYNIDLIQVYDHDFHLIAEATRAGTVAAFTLDDAPDVMARVALGETVTHVIETPNGSLVASIVPVRPDSDTERASGGVVVIKEVTRQLIRRVQGITKAFEDYKQLTLKKEIIKASYQVTLALVALVIVFSAVWVGFYLAKGITIPLTQLSHATDRIAAGDLTVTIDAPPRDDEVGQLIDAFNKMTHDLRVSEERIRRANVELTEANEELRHWGQYIEAVLENVAAGVISIDKSGTVTTLNGSAARMLGVTPDRARGKHYKRLLDRSALAPIRQIFRDQPPKKVQSMEREVEIRLNGERRVIKTTLSTLTDHEGAYLGAVMVFDDLTALIAAQRSEAWREMARVVAHEIKNPLTPIQLNAQRMRRKFEKGAPDFPKVFDDATNTIIQEVTQLKSLVNKFSQLAKMGDTVDLGGRAGPKPGLADVSLLDLSPEPAPLHDVIDEVVKLYRDTRPGVTLTIDLDPSVDLVTIDTEQIKRVFTNLVENAFDAIEGEGTIAITTRRSSDGRWVGITVADSGHGVTANVKERVFLPYFSTKPDGAGLGLAIVSRIIEDHGGRISIADNEPDGTTFTLRLPLA